jgi:hypothetical protein
MDDHPLTCTPDTEMDEVRRMMLERHARYMPVMSQRMLMGVISFLRRGQGRGRKPGLRKPHAQGLHPRLARTALRSGGVQQATGWRCFGAFGPECDAPGWRTSAPWSPGTVSQQGWLELLCSALT